MRITTILYLDREGVQGGGIWESLKMWISGKIDKEQIDVNRMDLFKGRKKLNDKESDESILTMRNIFTKKDRTTKPKPSPSVGSADKEKSEKMSSPGDTTVKKREESQASPDKQSEEPPQSPGDTTVNKPEESQARPDKTSEESDDQLHSDDPKADETKDDPSNESSKDESKDNIHEKKTLEQEWRDALAKARQNLRTVVRKQLQDMGVDPDDLEKKFKTMMSKHGLGAQKNPNEESNGPSTVNQETSEADLVKESNQNIPETQEARGAEGNEKDDPIISKASLTKEAEKAEAKPEPKSKLHVDHPDGPAIASTNSPADKSDSSPDMVGLKAALNNKLEKLAREVDDMEKDGRLKKDSRERKMLLNIKKLITGMDRQNMLLMKKEETLRRALEKHLDELSDRFNMEATMMKRFMDDIDDGLEGDDDYLKDVVERLKRAMHSFDEASRSLSTDMAAVKNLNQEIHSKLDNIIRKTEPTGDQGRKFFRLAAKANLLLRRLLQRSAQLDKEMRIIREISKEADTRRQEYLDNEVADDLTPGKELEGEAKVKMNNIVERLKNMIKDIDTGRQGKMGDPLDPLGMENIKVRVTKIKGENGQPVWSENDEDADETAIESRLRMATKRMERIVKEQLRDAGVAPAGKIRVKIITSKEALENMGSDKGMQILSDEETSEFKKMVLNLLGGNQDAVEERKNHMALENNYNLVWDENHLSKAPSEDDDEESEAELTFDDTPF
ncbi:predicted protein [Nematostella vectensis]|uniref:Uncharacterized protein n=1 Tax=Nematostella vectensis TaxID=45351 RepID=A7SG71_NEMVE|nr:predicted protein [Nematostella vectensis]|eukprot:XP_001629347.1 predicted protein [Nematostella vectensis]